MKEIVKQKETLFSKINTFFELPLSQLKELAFQVTQKIYKNKIYVRGIIEFSNYCKNNCLYCGLRRDNRNLKRYRMSEKEIIKLAEEALRIGFKTIVLQSGEDPFWTAKRLSEVVREIKRLGAAVTLSVGELTFKDFEILKKAGADRYLLKFETSDKKLFQRLKPDTTFEKRIECLKFLRELDYEVGSGIIVGLPGQTKESLKRDILLMKELDLDMIGIGPFLPHKDTPLGNYPKGDYHLTLRMLSLSRIFLPYANIPATTALDGVCKNGRLNALEYGPNVLMPDITPPEYRTFYLIYPEKRRITLPPLEELKEELERRGFVLSCERGDSLAWQKRKINKKLPLEFR